MKILISWNSIYFSLDFDSVKRPRYHCQDLYKIQFESLQIVRLGIELFWLFEWNFDEFIKIIFKKNQNPIRKKKSEKSVKTKKSQMIHQVSSF